MDIQHHNQGVWDFVVVISLSPGRGVHLQSKSLAAAVAAAAGAAPNEISKHHPDVNSPLLAFRTLILFWRMMHTVEDYISQSPYMPPAGGSQSDGRSCLMGCLGAPHQGTGSLGVPHCPCLIPSSLLTLWPRCPGSRSSWIIEQV